MTREVRVSPLRELAQRGAGVLGVDEAERGQALLGRLGAQRPVAGQRVEQRREEEPLVDRPHGGLVRAVLGRERLERGRVAAGRGSRAPARVA